MSIKEFVTKLQRAHFILAVEDGRLILRGDKTKLGEEQIAAIKKDQEVINYIKANRNELVSYISGLAGATPQKRGDKIAAIYALSGLQEGMLFHGLYDEAGGAYLEQFSCEVKNADAAALRKCWDLLLQQHSILRSSFNYEELGMPVQCVYKTVTLPFEILDYRDMSPDYREQAIREYIKADERKGFNYNEPPLMRVTLLQTAERDYQMIWTYHHILLDGWSIPVLIEELLQHYEALTGGQPVVNAEEDLYEDYIRYIENRDKEQEEKYWQGYMAGLETGSLLPFISTIADRTKGIGSYKAEWLRLDEATSSRIQRYAQSHGVTVNTVMQGVWGLLLHHYTGAPSVTYGVTVSGRPADLPGVDRKVGLYINTLPVHVKVDRQTPVDKWLQQIQQDQIISREYEYTPLSTIQRWTGITGDLFDSILVYENYPVSEVVTSGRWKLELQNPVVKEHTNYPLSIMVGAAAEITLQFSYNTALLEEIYVQRLAGHFREILLQLISLEQPVLADLRLLTAQEEQVLLYEFAGKRTAEYPHQTFPELFAAQVNNTPDAPAVVFGGKQLTYRELDTRANQLAHYLQDKGVQPGMLIPVCIHRSLDMLIGIMGILKAGATFVPIEPVYPADRIRYMLEDTAATFVVSSSDSVTALETITGIKEVVLLDKAAAAIAQYPETALAVPPAPEQAAYVIYTSGSTGMPKGVIIEHRSLLNFLYAMQETLAVSADSSLLAVTTYCFDIAYLEFFLPLTAGGKVIVAAREQAMDAFLLMEQLTQHRPAFMQATPATWQMLIDAGWQNKEGVTVLTGGEAIKEELKDKLVALSDQPVWNLYGPTEATIWATVKELKAAEKITIGQPLNNTDICILDKNGQLCPVGVIGELCISGIQLARGYLNRETLTAEKFIPHPYKSGERLYYSGDLARWLPDGNIECLGRIDDQVKIRGYRIELGEIENVLQESGLVYRCVVVAKPDNTGNKRLVGYAVPKGEFNEETVQGWLSARLPDYMVPGIWIVLEEIPLTANGKINRKALPDPDMSVALTADYVAPRTATEEAVVRIWQQLLDIPRVGIHDEFFKLGGHSLLAMRLVAAIRKELSAEITVKDVFVHRTVAAMAQVITGNANTALLPPLTIQERPEHIPLSFSQERLWVIDQLDGSVHYHIPAVLKLTGQLHHAALQTALQQIVNRHEVLRTVVRPTAGADTAYQQIQTADNWLLDTLETSDAEATIAAFINRPFNLQQDYMLRAGVISVTAEEHILVCIVHHIAADGWSVGIMIQELSELYAAAVAGRASALSPLPVQYADYALWQRGYMSGERLEQQKAYWIQKLSGVAPLELPVDYPRPAVQSTKGATTQVLLDQELLNALHGFSRKENVTLYMTLLATFQVLLYRYSRQEDISVGIPVAGRRQQEVEGLIGFFVNTLAIRSDLSGTPAFSAFLQQVKTNLLEGYDHQDLPFEKITETVVTERNPAYSPLFQVLFALQNTPEETALSLGDLTVTAQTVKQTVAKFDLSVTAVEQADGLLLSLEYCTDLFAEQTILNIIRHYEQLLRSVLVAPTQLVSVLPMLTVADKEQLLQVYAADPAAYPLDAQHNLVSLFTAQVQRTPDATAVVSGDTVWTYRQLEEQANRVAHYLIAQGIQPGALVPVCTDRRPALLAGMLGILKAGAAYVPVDTTYPADRIAYMLSDVKAALVLTTTDYAHLIADVNTVSLDDNTLLAEVATTAVNVAITPADLAYVIYTSGSTGRPKGVMVTHHNVVNLTHWHAYTYQVTADSRATAMASIGFDAFGWEVWPYLLNGSSIYLVDDDTRLSPDRLPAFYLAAGITHSFVATGLVPAVISSLRGQEASLTYLLTGGDRLPAVTLDGLTFKLVNNYGPTENTVVTSYYTLAHHTGAGAPPIGRAVSHTKIYILGPGGEPVPVGVAGELCVSGVQVARGYLNMPALTAEKFVTNPFSDQAGDRMYRTGDLARWLPDGNVEYLGRVDDQVKIRGYRIELGEIESVLQQSGLVKQGVVLAKADANGHKRLVGYVTAKDNFDQALVETTLKARLPEYMVPAIWVVLDAIPLTSNGKVNRNALPEPDTTELSDTVYTAPRNATEVLLANIWQDVLGVKRVGIHDNFFKLGGDSIITIQVVSRVKREGYSLQARDIFVYQTISRLSDVLQSRKETGGTQGEQAELSGVAGLLPIQQWFFEQAPVQDHFNQHVVLSIDKKIPTSLLSDVLHELQLHHDALRFRYQEVNGNWEQLYTAQYSQPEIVDLSATTDLQQDIAIYGQQYQESLQIRKGEVFRAVFFRTADAETYNRLVLVIHHLSVDVVSWRILLEDLSRLLEDRLKGIRTGLGVKGTSYRQWYATLAAYGQRPDVLSQQNYWEQVMKAGYQQPEAEEITEQARLKDTGHYTIELDAAHTRQLLQEVPAAYHTEINDILLAALARVLSTRSGKTKVVVGLEGHGREEISKEADISRTVGWFTNLYPVLLNTQDSATAGDLIKSIKEQLREIPDKGLGYGVLKYINRLPALQGVQPWELVFNYLGQLDGVTQNSEHLHVAGEAAGREVSAEYVLRERITVNSMVQGGVLSLNWTFSTLHYDAATVAGMADAYRHELETLIAHCVQQAGKAALFTPSDYGLTGVVPYRQLDQFLYGPDQLAGKVTAIYRLSGLQEGMLFHGLYDDHTVAYIEQFVCTVSNVDTALLQQSWEHVLSRHSILRSSFNYEALSVPVQCVYENVTLPFEVLDYRHAGSDTAIAAYIRADQARGFDYTVPPLMRITLLQISDTAYRMVWTYHHLLLDGWSLPVLIAELLQAYENLSAGTPLVLEEEDRYEDYIRYVARQDKAAEEQYWRGYIGGLENPGLLPFIPAGANRTKGIGVYEKEHLILDATITTAIQAYAQRHGLTVNTLMQGAWGWILHNYTRSESVVFGVTVSGRNSALPGIEQKVGMYINTLPLHIPVDREQEVAIWLRQLQEEQIRSREYEYTPLNNIQRWSGISGDLFDSLLVYENYPVGEAVKSAHWKMAISDIQLNEHTNYPLSIVIAAAADIHIQFSYNKALLEEQYVRQLAGHFSQVLQQMIASESAKLGSLSLLTAEERITLQQHLPATQAGYPLDTTHTLVDLFAAQAQRTPDATAVVSGDRVWTYRQLEEQANRVAHYLIAQGIQPGALVPVCTDRRPALLAGMLGVLKAGAAYVPVDTTYPADRIAYMLSDVKATLVLTTTDYAHLITDINTVSLDDNTLLAAVATTAVNVTITPADLAYVIYTSGSTGRPKGVMVTHHNVVNLTHWHAYTYQVTTDSRATAMASIGFDAFGWEVWPYLVNGSSVYLVDDDTRVSPDKLPAFYLTAGITHSFVATGLVPAVISSLRGQGASLTYLLTGGDRLPAVTLDGLTFKLVNNYGPTENTVVTSYYTLDHTTGAGVPPIGRAVSHTKIFILGPGGEPVPVGVAGELCVSGVQVARGYLNMPELTAEKFVTNPFSDQAGDRMYRTGDLARWLPDGNVEYLGRVDDQVKIRGYRIELGEIESVLQQSGLVKQGVVLAKADANGHKRLVGYVAVTDRFDQALVETTLKARLPEYMVPAIWVVLDIIPLTANGKVNRNALPEPDMVELSDTAYAAPRNATEVLLANIWQDVLGVKRVGIHDNFFKLGGDSIITIQVVSRVKREGYNLQARDIFAYQTISRLSEVLRSRKEAGGIQGEQAELAGVAGLLPIQQWFFEQTPVQDHFNQSVLLTIDKKIPELLLTDVLHTLQTQHDTLRFRYQLTDGNWEQLYTAQYSQPEMVDLSAAKDLAAELTAHSKAYQESLDIQEGSLFRAVLFRTPDTATHNRLLLVIHHLAVDAVSWRILLEDLSRLLEDRLKGVRTGLGVKGSSYRQWHAALAAYGQNPAVLAQQSYWASVAQADFRLPADRSTTEPARLKDTGHYTTALDAAHTRQLLQEVPAAYHTEINDILLTALARVLSARSGQTKVVIGLEGHGREEISREVDISRTVGWFTNLYPVLLNTRDNDSVGDLIKSIKEQLREIPDKGLGYGVLKYINRIPALQGAQPWDLVFNYLGQLDGVTQNSELIAVATESAGRDVSEDYILRERITVNSLVQGGVLSLHWSYSSLHFDAATIEAIADSYRQELEALIAHCVLQGQQAPLFTPSDYGLTGIVPYRQLDQFLYGPNQLSEKVTAIYRLSGLQEGMLFHGLYDDHAAAYIEQFVCTVSEVDTALLQQSWEHVLSSHSILRSGFDYEALRIPVQYVYRQVTLPFEVLDYRQQSADALQAFLRRDSATGFDYQQPPLMRITLLQTAADRYQMVWTFHHLLLDGWSIPVLIGELLEAYESLAAGATLVLETEDRYEDYIRYIDARDKAAEEAYWRGYMKGLDAGSLLPFIPAAADRTKGIGAYSDVLLSLDTTLTEQVQTYAQQQGITVNTLMQGVWSWILHKYTGATNVVYGVTVSGRNGALAGVEQRVGLYINTLPLHAQFNQGQEDIAAWLMALQQDQIRSREYEYTPLNVVQRWTNTAGELFDSLLVYENYPVSEVVKSAQWKLKIGEVAVHEHTNYPLNIIIAAAQQITIQFSYNTTLLEATYVEKLAAHFENILQQITIAGVATLDQLSLLTTAEQEELLTLEGAPTGLLPQEQETMMSWLAVQVLRTPEAIAIAGVNGTLTYHELDERTNQLARYLRTLGVQAEVLVPVCIEKSPEMLVAILSILKAGGAYVPIDPAYPEDRIQYILEDCKATILLTSTGCKQLIPAIAGLQQVVPEERVEEIREQETAVLPVNPLGSQLAYIIYTSGSTGKPKGVMISHAALLHYIRNNQTKYMNADDNPSGSFIHFSYTFDASLTAMFMPLLAGKTVVIGSRHGAEVFEDPLLLQYAPYDFIKLTPAHMQLIEQEQFFNEQFAVTRRLVLGGEALQLNHVQYWLDRKLDVEMINEYGPTESTVGCSVFTFNTIDGMEPLARGILIGRPIENVQLYIVDTALNKVPVGVAGELCIGGAGLARGYLNLPELSRSKFIRQPFNGSQERIYRTGDLARWLPDGNIEYLGRIDDQVKIRGYRIELGEIESVLQQSGLVQQSVVLAKTDAQGTKRLVGYVVADKDFDQEVVEKWLKARLPEYMVPALWVTLDAIPLTSNGKVNRRALPEPVAAERTDAAYVAPRNAAELLLAGIWEELLGVPRVGIHDNFFRLGGDSIITIQVVSRVKRQGYALQARDIFAHQTIARLGDILLNRKQEGGNDGEQGELSGTAGLLPIQQWFFEQTPVQDHFNQHVLLATDKSITTEVWLDVLHTLQSHHDALRLGYQQTADGWEQLYSTHYSGLEVKDLTAEKDLVQAIAQYGQSYQEGLNIREGDVFRPVLFRTADTATHDRLLLIVHHLAVDVVSWRILLEDLARLLEDRMTGQRTGLGVKGTSYRQWYQALAAYGQRPGVQLQQHYWEKAIQADYQLPVDRETTAPVYLKDTGVYTIGLDENRTRELLQEVPAAYHTEINDLLLAALAATLSNRSGQTDVVIGLEGHGREEISKDVDISRTVGWFTNLYPVLLHTGDSDTAGDLIKSIKEQLREIPDKGLGYGVLKYINQVPALQGEQPWQLVFNYLGQLDAAAQGNTWLQAAAEAAGKDAGDTYRLREQITINSMVQNGVLSLHWSYSTLHYEAATIAAIADAYCRELETLIAHCVQQVASISTPSDYGLTGQVHYRQLDQFLYGPAGVAAAVSAIYRLSGLQEGMLFHGLYDHHTAAYVEQFICTVHDADTALLQQSWEHVLSRHSILRSSFNYATLGIPVQCVHHKAALPFQVLDYRHMTAAEQEKAIAHFILADQSQGFDYTTPPLMRVALLRTGDASYRMIWTYHHLLLDGWSLPVLLEELLQAYERYAEGKTVSIGEEDRYEDYIRYINAQDKAAEEQYWRKYMEGLEAASLLPFIPVTADRTKSAGRYEKENLLLDAAFTTSLQAFAQQNGLTVNTVMQGAWAWILHHYTGQDSVVYGATVSGRNVALQGIEQRVGLYINTLPLHVRINRDMRVTDWLLQLQEDQIRSREYEYSPLNDVQRWAGLSGDLFDSILVYENYPVSEAVKSGQWKLTVEDAGLQEHTNYPLSIIVIAGTELQIQFSYNAGLLDTVYIHQLAAHFRQVLQQLISVKQAKLGTVSLLTDNEQHTLLHEFSGTMAGYPEDKTIIDLFEAQVQQTPDATAVTYEATHLTYRELDERANQLGHYLRSKGVDVETLVPICTERSLEMIVGIMGILKAGAAYVPIDPAYPEDRIQYMLEDTAATVVVCDNSSAHLFEQIANRVVIDADALIAQQPATAVPVTRLPHHVAYVIYTSGSTGRPKGVLIENENVVRLFETDAPLYDFNSSDVWTMFHSFCFDFSVWEMYGALFYGGRVVVVPKSVTQDTGLFGELLISEGVTVLNQTPSSFYVLQDYLTARTSTTTIRYVIFGGEALNPGKLKPWQELYPASRLINMYGITETTVHVTYQELTAAHLSSSASVIGKPIPTLSAYILDSNQSLVPMGVAGELYIGGAGVARGYLNRDELTATRFIASPFILGERLYRTGDLARWYPDGNLEYLGRIDDQVKIRGYRIELGEIEHVLQQSGLVSSGVVLAKTDHAGIKQLVGYVVPKEGFSREAVQSWLKSHLPEYMVPALWVELTTIPLTSNGKVNRKALPDPVAAMLQQSSYEAPRNATEEKLVAIWQELLGVQRIGIYDNFFALGGHSLLTMRLMSAIRIQLETEVSVKAIFTHATVAQLAAYIQETSSGLLLPGIEAGSRPALIPLSFGQERLWFIDRLEGSVQYHMPAVLRLKGQLHTDALTTALQTIVQRHEVLRTVMVTVQGLAYQQIREADQWKLTVIDGESFAADHTALMAYVTELVAVPFNLSDDYMLRAHLLVLNETEHVLVLTMHHIASDGWSSSILVQEIATLYDAAVNHQAVVLPVLTAQYADYAVWQRTYLKGAVLEQKLDYWKQQLRGVDTLNLLTDYPRPAIQSSRGAVYWYRLDKQLTTALQQLSGEQGVTLFMTLLSAFKILLHRYTGQDDICVGTSIAGRTQQATEGLIGFFVNTLALRTDVGNDPAFSALLQQVKAMLLEAYDHQDIPFEKVVEAVVKERDLSRNPLFQVMFELQNAPDTDTFTLKDLELSMENAAHTTSMFDMSVSLKEDEAGLIGYVEYCVDLFKEETIVRMITHFEQLLRAVVATPASTIGSLRIMEAAEEQTLLQLFSGPEIPYPTGKTFVHIFEEQAARTPDAIALVYESTQLTYAELDARANQLARYLIANGVAADSMIPICIERSIAMILGVVAIWKAGGAYVPVDPAFPADRITYIFEECKATIVLADINSKATMPDTGATILAVDGDEELWQQQLTTAPSPVAGPEHLAYVLYTSGSTGKPKGVLVEHAGLLNHLLAMVEEFNMNEATILAFTAPYTFDISVWQMVNALICGGRTIIYPNELILRPDALISRVDKQGVTLLQLVPSYLTAALQGNVPVTLEALQYLLVTGEAVQRQLLEQWFGHEHFRNIPVANAYGPTEASDDVSFFFMEEAPANVNVPVGKPIRNLQLYVLDAHGRLCTYGVPGEICVGGIGVARGYLNRPDLTAEKFVADPYHPGQRMYKTGDLGRWLPDGNIEYLGRMDDQVKIRGYRIELGEIETVLQQYDQVSQAVVVAKTDHNGMKRLVGYVVPKAGYNKEDAIACMQGKLPEYMIPVLIPLERLPLTPNGKVDKKNLPDPVGEALAKNAYVAPRNKTEEILAGICQQLLQLEKAGVEDNLFELGMHSLLVMRLAAAIFDEFRMEIPVRTFFQLTTIEALAQHVEAIQAEEKKRKRIVL
ncbi:non-ribosomal peptide synthase/polyketide synthase [Chitinophaga nivalis]|uniref:Non-ribosomal peptide synthase/polyketide synthase n=1 Tax=Chitinophaga nivalis TaxID=2991709 RepID=A0ABT3IGW2_9BACT|nr:non-ribosomal peptide synthase/polyketide synthase [Chitinophaga nivalis]MCW3467114.1 non-ribosomal peptide synthase/polyketide synthase [Chitinophaga nivalis]MCW3483195.1 non-ribosomal peptide synthase/polyketide synthase [Chitinophaga nivalis]